MKQAYYFLALAATSLLFTQSCKKMGMEEKPVIITQTVNTSIIENASYTFALPATNKNSVTRISTLAAHSAVSTIDIDANGNNVYQYTPTTNYTGTDVVVITTQEAEEHGGHHGGCNHGGNGHPNNDDQTTITTINITITPAITSTAKYTGSIKANTVVNNY